MAIREGTGEGEGEGLENDGRRQAKNTRLIFDMYITAVCVLKEEYTTTTQQSLS